MALTAHHTDASHLHNKPLQVQPMYGPREVGVPCAVGNHGRMPCLAQISGVGKVTPATVRMAVAEAASSQVQK